MRGDNIKMRLRGLERVVRFCSACETMEDYEEGCLMVWIYDMQDMPNSNSIVGLYFKENISYHGNAQGPQKRSLNFSFCKLSEKLIR